MLLSQYFLGNLAAVGHPECMAVNFLSEMSAEMPNFAR